MRQKLSCCPNLLPRIANTVKMINCQFWTNLHLWLVKLQNLLKIFFFDGRVFVNLISVIKKVVPAQFEEMRGIRKYVDLFWGIIWILKIGLIWRNTQGVQKTKVAQVTCYSTDTSSSFFDVLNDEKKQVLLHLCVKVVEERLLPRLEETANHCQLNFFVWSKNFVRFLIVFIAIRQFHFVEA